MNRPCGQAIPARDTEFIWLEDAEHVGHDCYGQRRLYRSPSLPGRQRLFRLSSGGNWVSRTTSNGFAVCFLVRD